MKIAFRIAFNNSTAIGAATFGLILAPLASPTGVCGADSKAPASTAILHNQLTSEERASGWTLLFDGKSFAGWRGYRKTSMPDTGWAVANGELQKVHRQRGGDIITEKAFDDYELSWEWKIEAGGNNGIKYLVREDRPGAPGHEYQMIDDKGSSEIGGRTKWMTGTFYDVLPCSTPANPKPPGEWNRSRVRIQGNQVSHWLNEVLILTYELGSPALQSAIAQSKFKSAAGFGSKSPGHIMLTDHGDGCSYRTIKLRELQAKSGAD